MTRSRSTQLWPGLLSLFVSGLAATLTSAATPGQLSPQPPQAKAASATPVAAQGAPAGPQHAIALHGLPAHAKDFRHFDWVNPDAPKGGRLRLASLGGFDSLNPFIIKGNPAEGLMRVFETLMQQAPDEPFSQYGLLAESIEISADHAQVTFRLRPNARWHDGQPVTADDVVWTFETLQREGQPFYRSYYGGVSRAEALDARTIRFTLADRENRELPLILGQLPVLPKHWWKGRDFSRVLREAPLGSGPYRIESFDPGRRITYQRVKDHWGDNLPVNRGQHNFDTIEIDSYRDGTVALEAFKADEYDFRLENSSKSWATAYDVPAVTEGRLRKEEVPHHRPAGMQAFIYNSRRKPFDDPRMRAALGELFDFEWANKNLFHGQYTRTRSFFDNSELAASGKPGPAERRLLEPWRDKIPSAAFETLPTPSQTDGSGNIRPQLKQAHQLLVAAGFHIDESSGKLLDESGKPLKFEILLVQPEFERVVLPWQRNLERLGIEVEIRTVDAAQYRSRLDGFDFDVTVGGWPQSLSPGNEQRAFFGTASADAPGSSNLAGIRSPAVDALIEEIVRAPDRAALVSRVRALDRVLLAGNWVTPQWHLPVDRLAFWNRFGRPGIVPDQGVQIDAWWSDLKPSIAPAAAAGG